MISGFDFSSWDTLKIRELQTEILNGNIYFAYLRASHGVTADQSFGNTRASCDNILLLNGAFHFVMPNLDIDQQVALLKSKVTRLFAGNLPPCLDFEWTLKKDRDGNVTVPEYWNEVQPADRIALIRNILQKAEHALGMVPAVYTHPVFWNDYIVHPNPGADLGWLAHYPLWLVDLHGGAVIPPPWTKANFVQNSFGENAPAGSPWYATLDHDFFNGGLNQLMALTYPGFKLSMSASPPVSAIVRDCQVALNALNIDVGAPDGRFGSVTKTGLQKFQNNHALADTGEIDMRTLAKLLP
jgi:hypothetical protein